MSKQTSVVIFLILGLNIVLAANQCYKCSTISDPKNCSDPFLGSVNTCKTVSSVPINCIKYTYPLNGDIQNIQTYRGCRVAADTCDDIKKSLLEEEGKQVMDCCICNTNLCTSYTCNAGHTTEFHFVMVALLLVIFLIFNH